MRMIRKIGAVLSAMLFTAATFVPAVLIPLLAR